MAQSLRMVRLKMVRAARPNVHIPSRTFLAPTAALRADLVQDLYLRELKAFKPTPTKAADAEGQVHKFAAPKAPRSPEEGDIAQDLRAYEEQQVEVEGQAAQGETVAAEEDWFEAEEEEETSPAH